MKQPPKSDLAQAPAETIAGFSVKTWGRAAVIAGLLLALLLPLAIKGFLVFQLTLALIYAVAILGLNLLTGFNGQFSLGHSAFYGIGAYTAAILMDQADLAYYWTLPAAGAACFIVGFLFGLPALRLEGLYLALATFALAIALFVGLVIGGVGSIPGTLFGGLFVLFVPNIAEEVSKGLAQAVYGVILIAVIYVMPSGAAGFVRLIVGRIARSWT